MDTERVVEVWVPDTQEVGSGYLLTNSLVLTAYHVVKGIRKHARIEVRPLSKGAGRPWLTASMCWPSRFVDLDAHPEQDAALLVISPSDRPTEPLPGTVRFGQVVGQKPIPCIGLGFPEAEERPDNVRDTLPVRGKVDPLHGYKAKLLTVHIDEGVVPLGWSGASGEALFCGPLLVGVLATDHRIAADNSVLLAVPVSALASLPGFRDALTTHGIELHIEPAPVSKTERLLKPYFAAVSRAVREQPYPGLFTGRIPPLAQVYMRQQVSPQRPEPPDRPGPSEANPPRGSGHPTVPADEVFRTDCGICILRAEPGIGKSTLLRAYISNSVDHWLSGRVQRTIPLMVNAVALAGTDPLPAALARASTSELKQFGLLDEVTPDFFRHQPRAGVPWLVLVDGLDEVPDTDARSAILRLLADTAETSPTLYRFVVATRPLPTGELDDLGPQVPHFQLQPFSPHDLHDYAMRWFRDLDDPPHHARTFTAELQRSGLSGLARTPLMASMLCQLYAANPARSLPGGRTGVYQSFVELIYEQNTHKHIASAHDKAIQTLKNRHQIPKDSLAAEQAAQLVRAHLPELIDYLAYQRITVGALPAIQVLASHLHVNRPEKVKEDHWNHFIGDLLRPTGLLTQRADDFDFLHQTLLEYHAARYATRDEQARLQVLCDLFPPWPPATSGRREPPTTESSYLGFLLDGLLIPEDHIATLTAQHVEALTAHGRRSACEFLVIQVRLHTSFPAGPTAAQLNRFADDATLDDTTRVSAADALVGVDREAGITQLIRFADDAILDDTDRVQAAWALAEVERQTGITRLTRFADDNTLDGTDRVQAAWALAEVDRQTGITRLTHLADDNTLDDTDRVWAADALVEVDREAGITQLTCLADDAILDDTARVRAAWAMTKLDRLREDAVARLTLLVNDTTLNDTARVQAAWALAEVDQEACITRLTRFADDAGLDHTARVRAAWALATKVDRHAGIIRLARFADDNTLDDTDRVWAADALAEVDREAGATRLTHLADNALLDTDRVDAAWALAKVNREAGITRLTRFANDAALDDTARVRASWALAKVDRLREAAIGRLTLLVNDTTLDDTARVDAAWALAKVNREAGITRLTRFANDAALDDTARVRAADALAKVDREAGIAWLTQLANDTDLGGIARVWAAEALAEVDREAGIIEFTHLADDLTLSDFARTRAVRALAKLLGGRNKPCKDAAN